METLGDCKTVNHNGRKFTKGFDNGSGGRGRNKGVNKGLISGNNFKIPATYETDSCKANVKQFECDNIVYKCYRSSNNNNDNLNENISHNTLFDKSATNATLAGKKSSKSSFNSHGHFPNSLSGVSNISQSVVNVQVFRGRGRLSGHGRGISPSPQHKANFRNGNSGGHFDFYSSQCNTREGFKRNNRRSEYGFESSQLDMINGYGGKGLKSRQRGICPGYGKQSHPVSSRIHNDYRRGIIDQNDNSNIRFSSYRSRPDNSLRVESLQAPSKKTNNGNPLGMYWPKLNPFKENQVESEETLNLNKQVHIQDDVDVKTSDQLSHCVLSTPVKSVHTHNSFDRSNRINGFTHVGFNDSADLNRNDDCISSELHDNSTNSDINENDTNAEETTGDKTFKPYEDSSSSSLSVGAASKDLSPSKKDVLKSTVREAQSDQVNNYSSVAARHCSPSLVVSEPVHLDGTDSHSCSQDENMVKVSQAETARTSSDNGQNGDSDKTAMKPKSTISLKDKEDKLSDGRRSLLNNNRKKKKKGEKGPESYIYHIRLDVEESFDNQAESMIKQFEMTPWERLRVDHLKFDVHRVFGPILPNAEPVLFGSVVAGTAFKNSDVDIYLKCFNALPAENVRDFIVCYGSAVNKGGFFKQGIKIPFARVPIVKAIHNYTGMSVDISFVVDRLEPNYGLCNSLLVKHLCSRDIRVRNLIMLVLFWAKYHGFVGKYQMSSFTFILLAVFYLQIVEILPPLYKLISITEDSSTWPNLYLSDPNLLINSNNENLESLYLGFFTFYSQVRFNEVVISVFAGELILGVLFESPDMLPECYAGYKRLVIEGKEPAFSRSDMCIQEPFNMSWNTARSVPPKTVELLKQSCLNVCKVFAKFSSKKALLAVHSQYQPTEGEDETYSWELPCPLSLTSSAWFNKVLKATRLVFNSILLMEILEGANKSEDLKFCQFYVANCSEENPVKLIVSSEYMLPFKERETLVKAYKSKNISAYDKEVKASNLLLEELKKKEKKRFFKGTIHVARNEKNGSVEVSVSSYSNAKQSKLRKNDHKQFVAFLRNDNFKHFLTLTLELDETDLSRPQ